MCGSEVRLQFQSLPVTDDGVVQLALGQKDIGQVVVCRIEVRLQFQSPPVAGDGVVLVALSLEGIAEVIMKNCVGIAFNLIAREM